MSSRKSPTGKAFTLVELVIVIMIVTLLIGLLVPTYNHVREAGRVVQCSSNLHQIDTAFKVWQTDHARNRATMHLPQTFEWIAAVQTVTKDDRILFCPDADKNTGTIAPFTTPSVVQQKKFSGQGHPVYTWTPDPAANPNANSYTLNLLYQQGHAGVCVVVFNRLYGNYWKAVPTRIDAGGNWGGPPIDMTWGGSTWSDIQPGQTYYTSLGTNGGTNYGYNLEMANAYAPRAGKVVAMDYNKMWIDYSGTTTDDDASKYLVGRHYTKSKINVLFTDSSIQMLSLKDLDATTGIYHKD